MGFKAREIKFGVAGHALRPEVEVLNKFDFPNQPLVNVTIAAVDAPGCIINI
jgi:hypothetical protein